MQGLVVLFFVILFYFIRFILPVLPFYPFFTVLHSFSFSGTQGRIPPWAFLLRYAFEFLAPPYFGLGSSCNFVGKSPQLRKLS